MVGSCEGKTPTATPGNPMFTGIKRPVPRAIGFRGELDSGDKVGTGDGGASWLSVAIAAACRPELWSA